jgi:hypothetical protein
MIFASSVFAPVNSRFSLSHNGFSQAKRLGAIPEIDQDYPGQLAAGFVTSLCRQRFPRSRFNIGPKSGASLTISFGCLIELGVCPAAQ